MLTYRRQCWLYWKLNLGNEMAQIKAARVVRPNLSKFRARAARLQVELIGI